MFDLLALWHVTTQWKSEIDPSRPYSKGGENGHKFTESERQARSALCVGYGT